MTTTLVRATLLTQHQYTTTFTTSSKALSILQSFACHRGLRTRVGIANARRQKKAIDELFNRPDAKGAAAANDISVSTTLTQSAQIATTPTALTAAAPESWATTSPSVDTISQARLKSRHVHQGFPPEPFRSAPRKNVVAPATVSSLSSPTPPISSESAKKSNSSRLDQPRSTVIKSNNARLETSIPMTNVNSTVAMKAATTTKKTSKSLEDDEAKMFPKKLAAFPFVPGATTSELTKAHQFFTLSVEFVKSATSVEMIPDNTMIPEVAFIGRSNIGKSSLINSLTNRSKLVKTSSKPGHTRMMNFFKIGDRLSLVDMPGYGFRSRDEWGGMILSYLQTRSNLKRIYILVDPSHGLKESDQQIMALLDQSALSYQVILTKTDKLSKIKLATAKKEIEEALVKDAICCFPKLVCVSSKAKVGLDELRAAIVKSGQLIL